MDILVTIPKTEYKNFELELKDIQKEDKIGFWTLQRAPKNIRVGDRVYFLKDKRIKYSMEIIEIRNDSNMRCDTTQREWSGRCQLLLDDLRTEDFSITMNGFMGFRYMDKYKKEE